METTNQSAVEQAARIAQLNQTLQSLRHLYEALEYQATKTREFLDVSIAELRSLQNQKAKSSVPSQSQN